MPTSAKDIMEYVKFLWPHRKTKLGLLVALLLVSTGWFKCVKPLLSSDKDLFFKYTIACVVIFLLGVLIWVFYSRRIIIGKNDYTVVLALKAKDPKGNEYIQNTISILKSELDKLGLLSKFRILEAGEDIISDIEDAVRYRDNFDLDLVIWGEVFSAKKAEKEVCDFKRLFFTYKVPSQVATANLTALFNADVQITLMNRDWNVYEFNSLPDIEKIAGNLMEVIMLILGIIYFHSIEFAEDSIKIIERLFAILKNKPDNEMGECEASIGGIPSIKFRKGRVLGILLNVYRNFGLYLSSPEKKDFSNARLYLNKYLHYEKKDIKVLEALAFCSFHLDDYNAAKKHTDEIGEIDKSHPGYIINKAFFGIYEKSYDSALHFYKEFIKRGLNIDPVLVSNVISFLDDRKRQNRSELAYDFAIGLLNCSFFDKEAGKKELRDFLKRAKKKPEYRSFVSFAQNEIIDKRKKR